MDAYAGLDIGIINFIQKYCFKLNNTYNKNIV